MSLAIPRPTAAVVIDRKREKVVKQNCDHVIFTRIYHIDMKKMYSYTVKESQAVHIWSFHHNIIAKEDR